MPNMHRNSASQEMVIRQPNHENQHRGSVGHIVTSLDGKYVVTVGIEDKLIKVWLLEDLSLLSSR